MIQGTLTYMLDQVKHPWATRKRWLSFVVILWQKETIRNLFYWNEKRVYIFSVWNPSFLLSNSNCKLKVQQDLFGKQFSILTFLNSLVFGLINK